MVRGLALSTLAVAVLLAGPLAFQASAENEVRTLCRERGGISARVQPGEDAVFAASPVAVFEADDPLARLAPGRLINGTGVATWDGKVPLSPCLGSGLCTGILLERSRHAYVEWVGAERVAYLISWEPSRACEGAPGAALPPRLIETRAYYAKLMGRAPSICRASVGATASYFVVPEVAASVADANPFGQYVQFRSWRVFRAGDPAPALSYDQFGVQTLGQKLTRLASSWLGVSTPDHSQNRCWLNTDQRPHFPRNTNSHFDTDGNYPAGRVVDRGQP
jgi:hypothetical protein